jgi:AraC family transcriptional regulator
MHKHDHHIKPEYQQRISKVLHYINQNLMGDVSLETLAGIANYSSFHFQKIFSESVTESPKQYVMRLRLERAAHYLKVFPDLPVVEIAMGCGFSSPSTFSRAFRNYYEMTAEDFRKMSSEDIPAISKRYEKSRKSFSLLDSDLWTRGINNPLERLAEIDISPQPQVKTFNAVNIACVQTTLSHPESISFAFKSLMQWAIPHDMVTPDIKYIGIWLDAPFYTSPDKCRYLAGIELKNEIKPTKGVDIIKMNEGKYASFSMTGSLESTLNHIIALNHKYLVEMGYEIAEIICYELFNACPANIPYEQIEKNILVPVKVRI